MKKKSHIPLLIVISAPSGAGKSTLCDMLMKESQGGMVRSVSCTTRKPRGKEIDGRDYYFLTDEEFESKKRHGELLECAVVHGHQYGTPAAPVEKALSESKDVLMAIDVQGARRIRNRLLKTTADDIMKRAFVDIFIDPPSMETLKERLTGRKEDSDSEITLRLANAAKEMACAGEYMYRVVNENSKKAVGELLAILKNERKKRSK